MSVPLHVPRPTTLPDALVIIDQLVEHIGQLERRIEELERQLRENSTNSSKPPSSDGPDKPKRSRPPTGRPRGGQLGHKGSTRALVDEPDQVVPCLPPKCACCGRRLQGVDPHPERHQITELPLVRAIVTEYQIHTLRCSCGQETTGALPEGADRRMFGPRLTGFIAYLAGRLSLSHRNIVELLHEGFGVTMAVGSIASCEREVSLAVRQPVEDVAKAVRQRTVAHADETGFREGNERTWLWVAVTDVATYFVVHPRRDREGALRVLGEDFDGWLITDRWSAYDRHPVERRQVCWAHLDRQFAQMAQARGAMGRVGRALVEQVDRLWEHWHAFEHGETSRRGLRRRMSSVREEITWQLQRGAGLDHVLSGRCREILVLQQALFSFVDHEGLEPTNNAAERAIRRAVIWRKISYGTQSMTGSMFVGRILTVIETLRQQGRKVLDYLAEACEARLYGRSPPSLLPAQAQGP